MRAPHFERWGAFKEELDVNFTDDERKTLLDTHSIVRDEQGREVLIGLTERETVRYMTFLRKGGSRFKGVVEIHNELRNKHERARAEAVETEHGLRMRNPRWA
jgi:hypothetical protein